MTTTVDVELGQVVNERLVHLDLAATDRDEALVELTDVLADAGCVTDAAAFLADVRAREEQGPTGLGQGVAIPHGKSSAVASTAIAIGRTRPAVEWPSLDGGTVDLIILFAVREDDASTTHLRLLQKVAKLLASEEFLTRLHEARTSAEVVGLIVESAKEGER